MAKRKASRETPARSKAAPRSQSRSHSAAVGRSASGPTDGSLGAPPCGVLETVRRAAAEHGDQEVEPGVSMVAALGDPSLRANAGRWRGGTETRRVTALLARLMNGLHSIKPSWLEGPHHDGEPLVGEALPVRISQHGPDVPPAWYAKLLRWLWKECLLNRWRTLVLTLVMLLFPRLTAMLVTAVVRLVIRACMAMVMRIVLELGKELRALCVQMSHASSSVEEILVGYVEDAFALSPAPVPTPAPSPGQFPPEMLHLQPGAPPAPHPFHWVSSLLLLVDIFLRVRPMAGAG